MDDDYNDDLEVMREEAHNAFHVDVDQEDRIFCDWCRDRGCKECLL